MKISIFTPTHDSRYLVDAYDSIKDQDFFEWVIVYNNGAEPIGFGDQRVKSHILTCAPKMIGPLKAYACEQAAGDILLELDHDDLLMPDAIAEVKAAFQDPAIGFAYSNALRVEQDIHFTSAQRFDLSFGWRYRTAQFRGRELDETIAFEPSPESVSRIWYAPDHLKAFRRDVYLAMGGYNKDMRVLDDLDLMCRMYLATTFKHIDRGLYVYRIHGDNSWLQFNAEIQQNTMRIYDQYIESLAERRAAQSGLQLLDLGGRLNPKPGYRTVDRAGADVNCDLNQPWPFPDSSAGVIRAFDVFEHLWDPIHAMREAARVLAPGGWLFCQVPSTDGRGAFQDPTHRSFWNENSFAYYTRADKARYIDIPVRFQATRLYTTQPDAERVCWTRAHLVNLKDGYRPCGLVEV